MRTAWVWLGIVSILTGCGHTLKVSSSPSPANVYFLNPNGTRRGLAGQTPLTLSGTRGNEKYYYLEVEHNGFIPQTLVIPQPHALGSSSSLSVTLQEQNKDWFDTTARGAFASETNLLVADFIELQTRIIEGAEGEVKRLIDRMKAKYDGIATFHVLVGGYHYSKKRYSDARAAYDKALKLDPNNADATQMSRMLKKLK